MKTLTLITLLALLFITPSAQANDNMSTYKSEVALSRLIYSEDIAAAKGTYNIALKDARLSHSVYSKAYKLKSEELTTAFQSSVTAAEKAHSERRSQAFKKAVN